MLSNKLVSRRDLVSDQGPTQPTEVAADTPSGMASAGPETLGHPQVSSGHDSPVSEDKARVGSKQEQQPMFR